MGEYCQAGKIECENYGRMWSGEHNGGFNWCLYENSVYDSMVDKWEKCPWPSKQKKTNSWWCDIGSIYCSHYRNDNSCFRNNMKHSLIGFEVCPWPSQQIEGTNHE